MQTVIRARNSALRFEAAESPPLIIQYTYAKGTTNIANIPISSSLVIHNVSVGIPSKGLFRADTSIGRSNRFVIDKVKPTTFTFHQINQKNKMKLPDIK